MQKKSNEFINHSNINLSTLLSIFFVLILSLIAGFRPLEYFRDAPKIAGSELYFYTNRPIIFAPFDYEKYITKDRELYYDYDEVTPGPKCKNWEEVLEWIVKFKENPNLFKEEREEVKNRFHKYQDGRNCERVFNEIVKL